MRLILHLAGFFVAVSAHAGAVNGGGGKGIQCPTSAKVELLDLWEARVLHKRTLIDSVGSLDADVDQALVRLKNVYPFKGGDRTHKDQEYILSLLREEAQKFLKPNDQVIRLRNTELERTTDALEIAKPRGCDIPQIVNYQPGGYIYIDQDLFEKMDPIQQAALIAHEALYATIRDFGDEPNSIRTRRAVGYVFEGHTFSLYLPPFPSMYTICVSSEPIAVQTELFLFLEPGDATFDWVNVYPSQINRVSPMGLEKMGHRFKVKKAENKDVFRGICSGPHRGGWMSGNLLSGPVEYDRDVGFDWTCETGQMRVETHILSQGDTKPERIPLTCREVQATAKH